MPQISAVIVDRPIGEGVTLISVIKTVARNVDLKAIGITVRHTRVTIAGGILLEVDSSEIALVEKMRLAITSKTRVASSKRRTSVLLLGIPHWVEEADINDGLATAGHTLDSSTTVTMKRR